MTGFTAVNHRGAYFTEMKGKPGDQDSFAVFELPADDMILIDRGIRLHFRNHIMKHVFERAEGLVLTMSAQVPR